MNVSCLPGGDESTENDVPLAIGMPAYGVCVFHAALAVVPRKGNER